MKTFKSENQRTIELLERNDVKEIKEQLSFIYSKSSYKVSTHPGELTDIVSLGDTLLELVSRNSNDFTKDITSKCKENEYNLSEKQAWCVAFQIKNNIEVYKIAMAEFDKECADLLNEVTEETNATIVSENEEVLAFREQLRNENKIIEEYGFFFTTEGDDTTVIFVNPCGKDETNFTKFSSFITEKTNVLVTEKQIQELYEIQQDGFKGYVKVDENHYLFCPIIENDFSIRLCIGNQETLKA